MREQQTMRLPKSISMVLITALSIAVSGCVITGHEIVENRVVVPAGAVAKVQGRVPGR